MSKNSAFILAECGTCAVISNSQRKSAFTLAEVLITLGIIGVVAAITLPTLIQNYKKQAYVTQLKKTVNTLENAFKLAMAEDGVDDLGDTQLWQSRANVQIDPGNIKGSEFINQLGKYIKIIEVRNGTSDSYQTQIKYLNKDGGSTAYAVIYLADGSRLLHPIFSSAFTGAPVSMIQENGGHVYKTYNTPGAYSYIDANGEKGPNQFGRDIFMFVIGQDGKLYPYLGKDYAIYMGATAGNYTSSSNYWNSNGTMSRCSTTAESDGSGCAARIIEEGWQMKY